jgi:hypothetical protein
MAVSPLICRKQPVDSIGGNLGYYNWYLSCARATQHPARLHGFDRDSAAHHRAAGEFVVASTTVH